MASSSSWRKPEPTAEELIDKVFSWSVDEVLNMHHYRGKVNKIPEIFMSTNHYTKSFAEPLLEETHAALLSKMRTISRASTRGITGIVKTNEFKFPKDYFYLIYLEKKGRRENQKGYYQPEVGDLIALANRKPRFANDLNRTNGSGYVIALVQKVKDEESEKIQVLCSKPLVFPGKESDKGGKGMFLAIHLVNLTTSIRIWQALHSKLDGKNMKIIDKVLRSDSKDSERCSLCSIEDTKRSASPNLQEAVSTLNLNASQETAVWSCIAARECHHQETVNLIWGPPGTGKTKTIGGLLFALWKMKCRTLTCTPTNNAVLEVAARFVSLVTSSLEYDTYGFGDIVIFGKGERMKIGGFQELSQVFLEHRVSALAGCFSWRSNAESMKHLLKHPKDEYNLYLHAERKEDDEDSDHEEVEITDYPLNSRDMLGNKIVRREKVLKSKDDKISFREFITTRFNVLAEKLTTMVRNLYTHMPTSSVSLQLAIEMMRAIKLIRSIRSWIRGNDGLRKILQEVEFYEEKVITLTEFQAMKTEFFQVIDQILRQTVSFPKFTDAWEVGNYCLENASSIFCTASSSIRLHTLQTKVELLVVDEAGQLRECESLIPLQLSGLRGVILIGDERQLPAMVQSKICEAMEFGRSLFERLVSLNHTTHLLNVQYRMHPMISSFPNKEFYGEKIRDGPNVLERSYRKQFLEGDMFGPYSFIHLSQGKVEFDETKSGKNMVEVAVIVELLAKLHKECIAKNQKISVGCITPYKAQVYAIQNKLGDIYRTREAGECEFSVNVRTVDGFQGCEEDVIIISTVTGTQNGSIGFLATPQRANVALTRARHCLWILGNGDTLKHSSPIWERLVTDAQDRGCFHVGDEDKGLAETITKTLFEVGQFDDLLDTNSILFKGAKWKVVFDDEFLKSLVDLRNPETYKEVHSALMKLSGGWRPPPSRLGNLNPNFAMMRMDVSGLSLFWSVDMMEDEVESIQVLRVWDILKAGITIRQLQLARRINKFYGDYSDEISSRCKEKLKEGDLEVPKTWSKMDGLLSGIAAMSLTKEAGSSLS